MPITLSKSKLTTDQEALKTLMSEISLKAYDVSWHDNIEYDLWQVLQGKKSKVGEYVLSPKDIEELSLHHEKIGGWMIFDYFSQGKHYSTSEFIKVNQDHQHGRDNWANGSNRALYTAEWLGAGLRYLIKRGKVKFNELYSRKHWRANVATGWILQILLFIGFIALLISLTTT